MFDNNVMSKSIYTLFLLISSNYLGTLFGCNIQRILTNNVFIKHLFGFMTMYAFAISYEHEFKHKVLYAIFYYVMFVFVMRTDYRFTIAIIVIFFIIHELDTNEELVEYKNFIHEKLIAFNIVLIVIGFLVYLNKQRKDHTTNWSWSKFLMGTPSCKRL